MIKPASSSQESLGTELYVHSLLASVDLQDAGESEFAVDGYHGGARMRVLLVGVRQPPAQQRRAALRRFMPLRL